MMSCQNSSLLLKLFSFFFLVVIVGGCSQKRSGNPRVLVFGKAADYQHASIPAGMAAIQKLGSENSFIVDTTTNADMFVEDTLKKYAAVIFLSTSGNVLKHL